MKRTTLRLALALVVVGLGAQARAATPKLMVPEVRAVGLEKDRVAGLSALVASEAARHELKVVAGSDLAALIGLDRQRQMLGCTDSGCLSEVAGALGVDLLLATEASKVGEVWLLSLTLLDARKNQALRRTTLRASKADALVELATSGVHEVLQAYPLTSGAATASPSPGRSGRRILGLSLDAAGVAAIAGGVVFGLRASDARRDADALAERARAGESASRSEFDARWSAAQRNMLVADVLYGAGALALGTGLYFTFTKGASPSPVLTLGPGAGGAVLSFSGVLP